MYQSGSADLSVGMDVRHKGSPLLRCVLSISVRARRATKLMQLAT